MRQTIRTHCRRTARSQDGVHHVISNEGLEVRIYGVVLLQLFNNGPFLLEVTGIVGAYGGVLTAEIIVVVVVAISFLKRLLFFLD